MPNWANSIDEKKVFVDLFDIYEQELLTIFQYVAPIDKMKISSNKIHELHMRVCAECENLAVKIAEKFITKEEYQNKFWAQKKEFLLKDADEFQFLSNIAKISHNHLKEILERMSSLDQDNLIKWIFTYPDMPFYLWILNQKLWICNKKIEFSQIIETNPEYQYHFFQPFELRWFQVVPFWWTHYNSIKHSKIANYKKCTLWDLVNSLWAYYMLLNYFSINIKNPVYDKIEIKSKIFKPTIWRLEYPIDISTYYAQYRENKPWFIKDVYIWDKRVIPWYYDENKKDEIQKKLDEALDKFILHDMISGENNDYLNNENYFFYYSYKQQGVIVQNYINNQAIQQPLWTLKMEKRFNVPKISN